MFVWTNLERTSRSEVAIPNLVNTYDAAVQAGLTNDADPSLSDLPGNSGSIWAGAYATVLGAIYGWMYDDGPGGENSDCTGTDMSGCWGHRDNILADANTFGNPTEMDAGVGTDSGGQCRLRRHLRRQPQRDGASQHRLHLGSRSNRSSWDPPPPRASRA